MTIKKAINTSERESCFNQLVHSRKKEGWFYSSVTAPSIISRKRKKQPAHYTSALNKKKKENFLTYIAKLALQNRF